jgi:hypothetical protein
VQFWPRRIVERVQSVLALLTVAPSSHVHTPKLQCVLRPEHCTVLSHTSPTRAVSVT